MARAGTTGTKGSAGFGLVVCAINRPVEVLCRFKEGNGEPERKAAGTVKVIMKCGTGSSRSSCLASHSRPFAFPQTGQ